MCCAIVEATEADWVDRLLRPAPHCGARARTEHEPFEQRIAREAVRAVHAGARRFSRGEQPRDRRPAVEVRDDASHDVMRGGTDRNSIGREIEAGLPARRRDQRKALAHERRMQMRERQIHRLSRALSLARDTARDPIAGGEIPRGIVSQHERLAVRVHEPRAFSAQRFR